MNNEQKEWQTTKDNQLKIIIEDLKENDRIKDIESLVYVYEEWSYPISLNEGLDLLDFNFAYIRSFVDEKILPIKENINTLIKYSISVNSHAVNASKV